MYFFVYQTYIILDGLAPFLILKYAAFQCLSDLCSLCWVLHNSSVFTGFAVCVHACVCIYIMKNLLSNGSVCIPFSSLQSIRKTITNVTEDFL